MSELCVWDLDGTIRPGSLMGEAVLHGIEAGLFDPARFANPAEPGYEEVDYFVEALGQQPAKALTELTDRLSEEAPDQAYDWALERLADQHKNQHTLILSHSPDFVVKAFAR